MQLLLRKLGELEEILRVTIQKLRRLAARLERLEGELTDRFEHGVAGLCRRGRAPEEVVVDERGEPLDRAAANGLGCFERAAANEDGRPAQVTPLVLVEQIEAPGERRP